MYLRRRNPAFQFIAIDALGRPLTSEYVIASELADAQREAIERFRARGLLVLKLKEIERGKNELVQKLIARPLGTDYEKKKDWYSQFSQVPLSDKERALIAKADELAPVLFDTAVRLWKSDLGPWIGAFLAEEGYYSPYEYSGDILTEEDWEDAPLQPEEFLFEFSNLPRWIVGDIFSTVMESEANYGYVPDILAIAILRDLLLSYFYDPRGIKPRICIVSKELCALFIRKHHSALSYLNPKGLLYTMGVRVRATLVAVASVITPGGGFDAFRGDCPFDGIVELSRIASDGSTLGASSMLAARALDRLEISGRRGVPGCLFVTYALRREASTTYLALVDKGLRPVAITEGKEPSGARKGASQKSLSLEPKIVWEGGPAAQPPNWSVLAGLVPAERILGAQRAFEAWEARRRKKR